MITLERIEAARFCPMRYEIGFNIYIMYQNTTGNNTYMEKTRHFNMTIFSYRVSFAFV